MDFGEFFCADNLIALGTIIGTILASAYMSYKTVVSKINEERKTRKDEVSKSIKKQSNLDYEILQEAEKVKELLDADRVQVYEFHNGTHYANGRSALKTTCTYETCRYGVKSCRDVLSGFPLSFIPNFIKSLLDNGELYVGNLEEIKDTMTSTYNIKASMGIKGFYDVVIHNTNGEPIGFVGVQFCNKNASNLDKDIVKKFAWFIEMKLMEE